MSLIVIFMSVFFVFFFKQKTAYEMRISEWSSDVCSSDLASFDSYPTNTSSDCEKSTSKRIHSGSATTKSRTVPRMLRAFVPSQKSELFDERRVLVVPAAPSAAIGSAACREQV